MYYVSLYGPLSCHFELLTWACWNMAFLPAIFGDLLAWNPWYEDLSIGWDWALACGCRGPGRSWDIQSATVWIEGSIRKSWYLGAANHGLRIFRVHWFPLNHLELSLIIMDIWILYRFRKTAASHVCRWRCGGLSYLQLRLGPPGLELAIGPSHPIPYGGCPLRWSTFLQISWALRHGGWRDLQIGGWIWWTIEHHHFFMG